MPEGDTLFRTAAGLRPYLVGRDVVSARAQGPGPVPQIHRVVGKRVDAIEAQGKNLLIRFDGGLELRTHLRMHGSWHRYRPGERWRRPPGRARLVLEVDGAVAVCFDAPVVELFETRAERVHPSLSRLGPDLLSPDFDPTEAHRRLRAPDRQTMAIGAALLDQRAMAGLGNIWRNETLFAEKVDPYAPVAEVDDATLDRLIGTGRRLLTESAEARARPCPDAGVSKDGPAMPTLRDGYPIRATQRRGATDHVLVPEVPGGSAMSAIETRCAPAPDGWQCAVTVRDDDGSSTHDVTVSDHDATALAAATDASDVERLLYETFDFLLEREPKESILRSFDISVVSQYFPDYEHEIRSRLAP